MLRASGWIRASGLPLRSSERRLTMEEKVWEPSSVILGEREHLYITVLKLFGDELEGFKGFKSKSYCKCMI